MSLIVKVAELRSAARLESNMVAMSILTLLSGEIETGLTRAGRKLSEATDAEVIAVIKKLIKSNNEMISLVTEDKAGKFVGENEILSELLPPMLSAEEIEALLIGITFGSVGEAVKALDEQYAGLYDRAVACKIAKALL